MKKKYIVISLLSILVMMIGVSYAYFTGMVIGEGKPMNVKASSLAIIFTDASEISENEIEPGWSTTKTFTVENKSGGVFFYDINIDNLVNTFVTTGYLQYKITSIDGGYNMTEYEDIPKSEEATKTNLIKNIQIENGKTHTYTIEFRYQNSTEDQSDDMGKVFSGSLSITESNIVVIKYKVNNEIQEEIPNKEEPYVVDNVECSNNAKGIWDEEKETVVITENATQTVCIVEFKEGHTVNILTSNGEIVSPVSKVVGRIGETTFTIEEKEGYKLDEARVVCDNGGEGSLTNNIITIRNIKQNNTCTVITNPVEITVTYNVNGGNTLNPTSKTVIYSGTYGSLPTPTRTGYTFSGWYTAATGGSKVIESTEVTSAVNHTIYARWNANAITLTLNNQSATTAGTGAVYYKYNTATYYSNSALSTTITKIIVPTKTGYTFNGYYTATNGSGTKYINADGTFANNLHTAINTNTTLYAHWTANTITVTYNQNGGSGVSPATNTVTYGAKYKLPTTNPTRAGYTFANWWTAASGGTEVTTNITLTNASDHSIYAHWNPNTITLTLNNQSATSAGSTAVYYKYNTATYYSNSALSTTITKITVPAKTGYTFNGYYTATNGNGTKYINADGTFANNPHTAINTNTTLYAHWTAKTITVTYNQNGGTGVSPASNTVTYGAKYKLPTTNPTRAGFTFANWWTAASGGTQVTTSTTLTNASNHSIYAHWNPNTITLTLNNQSATSAGSTAVYYKYNTATYYSNSALSTTITKITVPSRTGYTFGGYYTAANGGGTQYINASGGFVNNPHTALKANTTLYAKWTAITYNVTVNVTNGSTSDTNPVTVNHGETVTFRLSSNDEYLRSKPTISCVGGNYDSTTGILTISNITSSRTCNVTFRKGTYFTISSSSCPDTINNNTSACYIIANELTTIPYGGKTYLGCEIKSQIAKYSINGNCTGFGFLLYNSMVSFSSSGWKYYKNGEYLDANCTVSVTCEPL